MSDIKTQQALDAIGLYHDLLSDSDQQAIFEIAKRALRKAVTAGRAELIPQPIKEVKEAA